MKRNISHRNNQHMVARTAGEGLLRPLQMLQTAEAEPGDGDVLLIRGGTGDVYAARYAGDAYADQARGNDVVAELAAVYAVDAKGDELASLIAAGVEPHEPECDRHDWGAMGLPAGPRTRVVPAGPRHPQDDVALARESDGFRQYTANRRLSIGAGDFVRAAGRIGVVVTVDRREGRAELRFDDGTSEAVAFNGIAEMEQDR